MKKHKLTKFIYVYTILVALGFGIYAYNVQENGVIDIGKEGLNLFLFLILFFIGAILTGIDAVAVRDKGTNISKRTLITGIVVACIVVIWRVSMVLSQSY